MNCHQAREMVHPYVDGELDLVMTLDMEMHIRDCARCAALHRNTVALRSSIADGGLYFRAPLGLEKRIRSSLPKPHFPPRVRWQNWLAAAAAVALIAGVWLAARQLDRGGADRQLAADVTSAHVRSLMAEHLWDVKSTDQHTVKPWFDGKLDFAPPVQDFKANSFPLEGGRLDYFDGHPVAALVYRYQKHYINLFIWPAPGQPERQETGTTQKGYTVLHWIHGAMNYWAISDTSADTLHRFASVVQDANHETTKPAE